VDYDGPQAAGTVVIDTPAKFLYLVQPGGKALRYGIGVGRPGFEWAGVKSVSLKREWPDWRPPAQMLKRRPDLPRHMAETRSARVRSIWARRSTASTARTSRIRSAKRCRPAASAC
jgi:lipoprotein-anchoring transpeptidase ErfK/SrfK